MYNKALIQLVLAYCSKGKFKNHDFQRFLIVLYVLEITNTAALCVKYLQRYRHNTLTLTLIFVKSTSLALYMSAFHDRCQHVLRYLYLLFMPMTINHMKIYKSYFM